MLTSSSFSEDAPRLQVAREAKALDLSGI